MLDEKDAAFAALGHLHFKGALQYGLWSALQQAELPDDILGFLLVGEQFWLINGT